MTSQLRQPIPPPIGAIEAIARGFEAVTNRLGLILLPILLDLLLWLGPRLSVREMLESLLVGFQAPPGADPQIVQEVARLREGVLEIAPRSNLLSILNTTPLGVPSLMAGRAPGVSPLGEPAPVAVSDVLVTLSLMVSLYLAGLLLGAIYLGAIAQQTRQTARASEQWGAQLVGLWGRMLVLAIATGPMLLSIQFLLLVAVGGGGLLPVVGLTLAMWLVTYLAFSPHGLLEGEGVVGAITQSLRLVQWSMPATLVLFGIVLLLNWGLGMVWNIPADNSWLVLVGIAGHSYTATALYAATLIFYRDRRRWLNEMRATWEAQVANARRQVK